MVAITATTGSSNRLNDGSSPQIQRHGQWGTILLQSLTANQNLTLQGHQSASF